MSRLLIWTSVVVVVVDVVVVVEVVVELEVDASTLTSFDLS